MKHKNLIFNIGMVLFLLVAVVFGSSNAEAAYIGLGDATSANRIVIEDTGDIGIGNTNPTTKLDVTGSIRYSADLYAPDGTAAAPSIRFYSTASGLYATGDQLGISTAGVERVRITDIGRVRMPGVYGTTGAGADLRIESDGTLYRIESARRYKKDINYDDVDGDAVYKLKPVSYKLKALENAPEEIGFIAEDVEEVDPRLVVYSKEGTVDSLHYDRFSALLVKAVQDLNTKVDTLEARVSELEKMLRDKN